MGKMERFFEHMGKLMFNIDSYPFDHRQIARPILYAFFGLRSEAKSHAESVVREPKLASFYRGRWDGLLSGALMLIEGIRLQGNFKDWAMADMEELFLGAVRYIEDHEFGTPEI